jgi:hypothetical protein
MMASLYYIIQEMHSFSMRPAKYFYDKPLPKYLDPKTVLIYRPHPVKLGAYFCHSLLIAGRVYCPMIKVDLLPSGVLLTKRVGELPANPLSQ